MCKSMPWKWSYSWIAPSHPGCNCGQMHLQIQDASSTSDACVLMSSPSVRWPHLEWFSLAEPSLHSKLAGFSGWSDGFPVPDTILAMHNCQRVASYELITRAATYPSFATTISIIASWNCLSLSPYIWSFSPSKAGLAAHLSSNHVWYQIWAWLKNDPNM